MIADLKAVGALFPGGLSAAATVVPRFPDQLDVHVPDRPQRRSDAPRNRAPYAQDFREQALFGLLALLFQLRILPGHC